MRLLTALVLAMAILVAGCGPIGKQGIEEEKRAMKSSQFAELMKRPNIETISSRYEEMRTRIRPRLIEGRFVAAWQERVDSNSGSGCGGPYTEVSIADSEQRHLNRWTAEGNLPDEKWDSAVSAVAEIAREYGFGEPKVVVNRPSDHEVSIRDGYGAEMLFGTAKNTILALTTGCHLTVAAHQRGTPAPKPSY